VAEAKKKTSKSAKKIVWRAAKGEGKSCSVVNCKRPYRAKSYCFFHYKKWRQGELPHSRYRTCSKTDCRSKVLKAGLCEKHFGELYKKAEGATEAPAAAPAA
jgi:hypothetical protein